MVNAKLELLEAIKGIEVFAATIYHSSRGTFLLKQHHSYNNWLRFLEQLDFDYDEGYGGQELEGTVWLLDRTWLERREYDGSEWWEHKVLPPLPKELTE